MADKMQVDILLVEDNPDDAELAIRALRKHNLVNNFCHVADGEAALDFMFARGPYSDRNIADRPRMILLDLKLPKVDGLEVIEALKSDERTSMTPIVVLTTSKEDRDVIESYRLGVNSYIVKPVDFDKFVEAVKEMGMYWLLLNVQP